MTRRTVKATALSYNSMEDPKTYMSWLGGTIGTSDLSLFVAIEFDLRGRAPFADLLSYLEATRLPYKVWWYGLDDGRTEITQLNRLRHFVIGQNLAADYAQEQGADLLYTGAGIEMRPEAIPALRDELNNGYHFVGPYVPSYNQPTNNLVPGRHNLVYALPAGAVMLSYGLLARGLRWRHPHTEPPLSDDYGLAHDARVLGVESVVRTDVLAWKHPRVVVPVEQRRYDRRVFW